MGHKYLMNTVNDSHASRKGDSRKPSYGYIKCVIHKLVVKMPMNNKLGQTQQDCVLNTFFTWLFRSTDSIFPTHRRVSLEGHHWNVIEFYGLLWGMQG